MIFRITFDVFSGRPNPSIVLDGRDAIALIRKLGGPETAPRTSVEFGSLESRLGYRGLLVEQLAQVTSNLPTRFRVAEHAVITPDGRIRGLAEDAEEFILGLADRITQAGISDELSALIRSEKNRSSTGAAQAMDSSTRSDKLLKCPCAPFYDAKWWNDASSGGQRQFHNNCYNYATAYRSDTYAQPGRAGGTPINGISCAGVTPSIVSDGLALLSSSAPEMLKCPDVGNLIAMVVWPNWDFHCYRLGADGYWSHKPGSNPVTDLDNSGRRITDPRAADRGRYTTFCSFLTLVHGHFKLK